MVLTKLALEGLTVTVDYVRIITTVTPYPHQEMKISIIHPVCLRSRLFVVTVR